MSRKSYRVDVLPITRTPTRREIEWAEQRRAAGGAVDGERGLFLMNGGRDALGGHRALGAPIQSRAGAAGIARIGAAEARREDPYAYMDYQAVRDHLARLNDERGLGMSDVEVSRLAQERHNAARERRKKFDRYAGDPRYRPGASASKVDFMWDRPLDWDEQEAVPGAVRRGPRPQDGRRPKGKAGAATRTAQRESTYEKVVRGVQQDVNGGVPGPAWVDDQDYQARRRSYLDTAVPDSASPDGRQPIRRGAWVDRVLGEWEAYGGVGERRAANHRIEQAIRRDLSSPGPESALLGELLRPVPERKAPDGGALESALRAKQDADAEKRSQAARAARLGSLQAQREAQQAAVPPAAAKRRDELDEMLSSGGHILVDTLGNKTFIDMKGRMRDATDEELREARQDTKGGRSSRRDLFVDAVDPVAQGPDTNTVRGRIESLMGDRENAEYARIQKEFAQKKGRQMDVDTARLRALMGTGKLTRDDVMALGRELRAERDYSIASQLASQAVGGMPRDAMGYIVSQELDPGRRLGRDDTFENAQRRVASVLNNGLRRDLSDAQRLFLAHRYNLVPEVRRVVSFDHAPGFGGEYGTVAKGRTPLATYAPGSFYQPGTHRVLEAGSPELARAMRVEEQTSWQLGQLDSVDELFSRFTARHVADAARRVTSALRRKPEARRALTRLAPLSSAGAPAMWWERTGTWAPAGRAYGIVDPNWRRIRAVGTNQDAKGGKGR